MDEITVCNRSKATAQKKMASFADYNFPLKMTSVENYQSLLRKYTCSTIGKHCHQRCLFHFNFV